MYRLLEEQRPGHHTHDEVHALAASTELLLLLWVCRKAHLTPHWAEFDKPLGGGISECFGTGGSAGMSFLGPRVHKHEILVTKLRECNCCTNGQRLHVHQLCNYLNTHTHWLVVRENDPGNVSTPERAERSRTGIEFRSLNKRTQENNQFSADFGPWMGNRTLKNLKTPSKGTLKNLLKIMPFSLLQL